MYENCCNKLADVLNENKIKFRPGAKVGLWITTLLPLALLKSCISYPQNYFLNYKICAIFSMGMFLNSLLFTYHSIKKKKLMENYNLIYCIPCLITSIIIYILSANYILSLIGGILSTVIYPKVLLKVLVSFPKVFSYGEAALLTQSILLLIFTTIITLNNVLLAEEPIFKNLDISNCIIQVNEFSTFYKVIKNITEQVCKIRTQQFTLSTSSVGLLGIFTICLLTYCYSFLRKPQIFYPFFLIGVTMFILFPLHIIFGTSPLLWLINFLTEDIRMLALIIHWILCCMATGFIITKQIESNKKASTIVRKTFHLLAIFIYLPGFLYKCTMLYLASGVVLGIFIALELIRLIKLPPLAEHLQKGFDIYCDEKDAGGIALTPIYLLIGTSLPIWLHPAPCDMIDSAGFNLLPLISGLITIGFGDTGASFIGTLYGKHKWPNSKKSVEGTIGCILSQFILILVCYLIDAADFSTWLLLKITLSILVTSFVEAFTSQVDNLVLPLIAYVIMV